MLGADFGVQLLQTILFGVMLGGVYALAAMGLALLFGVANLVNFAHGEYIMLAMYMAFVFSVTIFQDPVLTPLFNIPLFFAIGVITYLGIFKRLIKAPPLSQIAATVGILVLLRNLALAIWAAEPKAPPYTVFATSFNIGPVIVPLDKLLAMLVSLVTLLVLNLFLERTRLGVAMRASADDVEAVSLMGVDTNRLFLLTAGISLALVGLSGSLIMTYQAVTPTSGLLFGLLTWAIVALAGLGTVKGILIASIIFGLADSLASGLWDPRGREIVLYGLFILILWIRPKGLFGRR
ncbi:branched-chain amino acid ABC transporter permease [Candidatus Caldarchaeum subterraneum]|uniref:Branched-chain amino acid transport system permease protein n=2 Tax=Thermoproteati TaxID=1783275 RepID=H5SNN9_9CREN|nr:branched-chain amino acid ABC transporter permease [Candidatus Caldarchaeum subterraneum]BAJ51239.1 branched-chain amino acid ABC transporter permease [Candidatus Caldarchaeum subterraneum]BAL57775.1 branched-chain amino acid transport system permease protein [uncultured crenarchaeote]